MPIIKSAKKRVKIAKKATIRNVKTKRSLKTAIKSFQTAISGGGSKASAAHRKAQSALDTAGKKGVMHKNKVARKQRQLAAQAKTGGVKLVGTGKKAAKPAAKSATKPVATKTPAKKSPVKKAVAKKPATTKTTKLKK